MGLESLLIFVLLLVVVAYVAHWVVTKFFPSGAQLPVLAIIGVVLLLIVIKRLFPLISGFSL